MNTQMTLPELDPVELAAAAPPLVAWKLGLVDNEEGVAQFMINGGPVSPQAAAQKFDKEDRRPDKSYWDAVKKEMHLFLCTGDDRYAELWRRINALEKKGTTAVVGVIAAFLGATIGAPATVVAGFVAVCLYGVTKVGKEAYCRYAAPGKN